MSIILKSYANIEFRFVVALKSEALPIIEFYNLKLADFTGYVNKIYKCSEGFDTIFYGHKVLPEDNYEHGVEYRAAG